MAQTDCSQSSFDFQDLGSRNVHANLQGGHLSSDGGGALFLREVENRCGLIKQFARCFEDRRNPELIEHPVADLLAQRINGLIFGQVRLKLFKIAVRIKVSVRRVLLEFASSFPRQKLFEECFGNLSLLDEMPA